MIKIQTRKIIALAVTTAYIIMTAYCLVTNKSVPETFTCTTGIIIGYYFGKSTALDSPAKY